MSEVDQAGVDERQAVLEEVSGHLAEVFDRVPGGVYLYLDPTHKVCNERLAEILGTTVEEWRRLENFRDTFIEVADRQAYCDTSSGSCTASTGLTPTASERSGRMAPLSTPRRRSCR